MAEEKKQLFRQKSIESIQSPESLNEYLKVTSPGVWILLAAVVVLLIGVVVWGFLGRIEAKTTVAVVSDDEGVYCLVPGAAMESVIEKKSITIDGNVYELAPGVLEPVVVSSQDTNIYVLLAGNLSDGMIVYQVAVKAELPADIYQGTIVTESITPASFLLN